MNHRPLHHLTLCILAFAIAGCVTAPKPADQVSPDFEFGAKFVSYNAAAMYLLRHPEQRPAFEQALTALDSLIAMEQWDPAAIADILATNLPLGELRDGPEAILFQNAKLIWERATATTAIDAAPATKAVARGIAGGLRMALSATRPPAS